MERRILSSLKITKSLGFLGTALAILMLSGCGSLSGRFVSQPINEVAEPGAAFAEAEPLAAELPQVLAEQPAPPPLTLLERIIADFDWQDESAHPKVAAWVDRYCNDPESFLAILQRSEPFLYAASDELRAHDLPAELVFLPFVESGFQTHVRSWSGAEGLWQFMPATATYMGLERDWWLDERRDPQRSTEAAAAYLNYLHDLFDDWYLALASYNAGEGNIRKAIRDAGSQDFWDLRLNTETASYLPKLLAVVHLLKHPEKLNLELPDWADKPYYQQVKLDRQIDLEVVAEYLGADQSFYQLNAHFVQRVSPPLKESLLLVPENLVEQLQQGLSDTSLIPPVNWQHYRVRSGDNLSMIADRLNTSVRAIMETNNLRNSLIHPGEDLLIPRSAQIAVAGTGPSPSTQLLEITVLPGDSVWNISRRTGVSMAQIQNLNELADDDLLHPGQRLKLPSSAALPDAIEHRVQPGDSLYEIALRYGVTIQQIRVWNSLGSSSLIRPGERLTLWLDEAG